MYSRTTDDFASSRTNINNDKFPLYKSYESLLSLKKRPESPQTRRVQVRANVKLRLKSPVAEPTSPYSKSITFRLNPATPNVPSPSPPTTMTKESEPKTFKSEFYFNPKLQESITQLEPKLHVDLSYCGLTDRDISAVVNQIINERKCTELWLCGNRITSTGTSILASSLINNSPLKSLDLSFNQISDDGAYELTEVLSPVKKSSIKYLHLSKNGITNDGANYIAEMLKVNQTLKELWLSSNEIGYQGVKSIANALAYHNKTLKYLSLSKNLFITDLCIDSLIEMLEHNQSLRQIWIKDCNFTEQGKMKLIGKVNRKKNFKIEL